MTAEVGEVAVPGEGPCGDAPHALSVDPDLVADESAPTRREPGPHRGAQRTMALTIGLAGIGFCGAYTTFSTWSFETVRLIQEHELLKAFLNASVSLVVGLAAAAGMGIGLLR